jgi:hypothetical protein
MTNPISLLSPEQQGVVYTVLTTVAVGAIGSGLEALGNRWRWAWLVALGKKLEAGPNDIPKLLGKRAPDPALLKPSGPSDVSQTLP